MATGATISNKQAATGILILSGVIVLFLFWLIYFAPKVGADGEAASFSKQLPAINATLNAISATFVAAGILLIKAGRVKLHVVCMVTATLASALFLAGYLYYHSVEGDTKFLTQGFIRPVYFFILISHIVLSVVVVPLILLTLFFSASRRFEAHTRIARWTYPVWLYVSVTGVIVFFFLRMFNVAPG